MGHLQAERLYAEESLREAQTPRYRVFSSEYSAQLQEAEASSTTTTWIVIAAILLCVIGSGELVATSRWG
ncbi:hypothetical protein G7020_18830 [Pseudomonas stutzeri]|nr:hypothetical protein [Stutzerimonas stutzeri]